MARLPSVEDLNKAAFTIRRAVVKSNEIRRLTGGKPITMPDEEQSKQIAKLMREQGLNRADAYNQVMGEEFT